MNAELLCPLPVESGCVSLQASSWYLNACISQEVPLSFGIWRFSYAGLTDCLVAELSPCLPSGEAATTRLKAPNLYSHGWSFWGDWTAA